MKKLAVVFVLSALSCSKLYAQDGMLVVWDSQMTNIVDYARTVSLNAAIRKGNKTGSGSGIFASGPMTSAPGSGSTPPVVRLRFTPSPEVSKRIKAKFTKALIKANPQSAEEIKHKLARQDVIADFARDMKPYGLCADDVGDAMTAYWITMWMIANQEPAPAVETVSVVQNQIRASVVHDPKIVRATERERQEIAEALIYETMLAFGMLNNATPDPVKLQELADDASRNMLKKGVDMRDLKLTSSGFKSS